MVAMAIGLVLVLAASIAFLSGKSLFNADTDIQAAQDTMRFVRYVVRNVVRQAGYADYAPDRLVDGIGVIASNATLLSGSTDVNDLNLVGATNTTVSGSDSGFGANGDDVKGGNDSLLVRFFGRTSVDSDEADTTMIDCLGQPVTGPTAIPSGANRAWSFFYVAKATDGEPELYCKRFAPDGKGGGIFHSQPIARGVEKFKVVFGYDGDGDSVPETWLDAQAIESKAAAAGAASAVEWRKVVAVRVGLVVRSARPNGDLKKLSKQDYTLAPLGAEFTSTVSFDPPDDGRFRLTTNFTLMLRNVVKDPS